MYGSEKWICETNRLKRWGYKLFGEIHVPGRLRNYHIIRAIEKLGLMDRPIRMLDAGCGRGDLAVYLARRCPHWQVVGLELEPEKVQNSKRIAEHYGLKNITFHSGRLEDPHFTSEFDVIVNADVLEHIEDDRTVIANLCRAVKRGGYVIVTSPSVPQRKHLKLVAWREKRIGFHPEQYGHVRDGYSKTDLAEKFESAGGQIVNSYFTFGFFGTLAFDLFFVIGDNKPHPVVFALLFPWLMVLTALDLVSPAPETGAAILGIARRNEAAESVCA
jgi:2-polyprenyl-3-methyl-5-hydroxy-6-metoxy-1,4-benzoquinol methylase